MSGGYYNHDIQLAAGAWDRGRFLAHWWRLYAGDSQWVPPYYPMLRRELTPARNAHLARLSPALIHAEALPRSARPGLRFDEPVSAVAALCDPRRRDGTGYLALLHCANDLPTLRHTVERALEALAEAGCRRAIGPVGLSPHLGSGLLQDAWDRLPPLHTPYDPPYLPELMGLALRPFATTHLYRLEVPAGLPARAPEPPAGTEIVPLDLGHTSTAGPAWLPLWAAACPPLAGCPPPDAGEVAFLLRWLAPWPLYGVLARVGGRPAGFFLLQGDFAPHLKQANGGRQLAWRAWLSCAARRPARDGRLVFGGVLPEWQGHGVGRLLWEAALAEAQRRQWRALTLGPLAAGSPGAEFVARRGARAVATYRLYEVGV